MMMKMMMAMTTSSQIQSTDGHPHSHTHSQLSEVCIIMQGVREVRGCENSKVTWYPRKPLPTSAKSMVLVSREREPQCITSSRNNEYMHDYILQ